MLLMGNEMPRSQSGNNGTCCQDNPSSGLNWSLLQQHVDIHRFARGLIRVRKLGESVPVDHHLARTELTDRVRPQLHGVRLGAPDVGG
jgi:isoamylase